MSKLCNLHVHTIEFISQTIDFSDLIVLNYEYCSRKVVCGHNLKAKSTSPLHILNDSEHALTMLVHR